MINPHTYAMKIDLNVLEHLGINLYSNVPSVLSEAVANAWDADATEVCISVRLDQDNDQIEIFDNGLGMTRCDVKKRFLVVGFRRRNEMPGLTPKGCRSPMGRKGIGKLSLFSIADNVEVRTKKDGQASALLMRLPKIREAIKDGDGTYHPESLPDACVDFEHGTRIILTGLRRRRTIQTVRALRKRLARRFSIIGAHHCFRVFVDKEEITSADRDYYGRLQYLWHYGDQTDVIGLCRNLSRQAEDRTTCVQGDSITISGWIGTVKESRDLRDEESGDNLNRIAIYVRGKLAQADILDGFGERGVYASYLIGELRIDSLDEDQEEDATTSSRQHIVEDDPRYQELKEIIGGELKYIQSRWSEWRRDDGVKQAMKIPAVQEWVDSLSQDYQRKAKAWIGRINRISTDDPGDNRQLVKHAILAFEFYRANQGLERLERIDDQNLDAVLEMFQELDGLELSLYGQIVKQRLSVIRTLEEKVDENKLERVIQKYLFDHLWLLDPHWERVEATKRMETNVKKLFQEIEAGLSEEEKSARIDIAYRKTAGKHVIVELKRPSVRTRLHGLIEQIGKYRSGLKKILEDIGAPNEPIEVVLLLGKPPAEWDGPGGKQFVTDTLKPSDARFVLYDELLHNAYKAYGDYEKKRRDIGWLGDIIQAIEDYAPEAG